MRIHLSTVRPPFWCTRREATLNWLALGLLLAAWNMADNDCDRSHERPPPLRGYAQVSVRAAQRIALQP